MKRLWHLPLSVSVLALAACASDKPANSAAGATTTTSARYPDQTMSSNVNDTSATGAATNESPKNQSGTNQVGTIPAHANGSRASAPPPTVKSTWGNGPDGSTPSNGTRPDTAVPIRDRSRSGDASSTNGAYENTAGVSQGAQQGPGVSSPSPTQDSSAGKLTPLDQGNNTTDLKITQHIRQEVVANSDLSFTAKNVKIITKNGKVTLRGQVKTGKERDEIEGTATRVAGPGNVDDQIVVKP